MLTLPTSPPDSSGFSRELRFLALAGLMVTIELTGNQFGYYDTIVTTYLVACLFVVLAAAWLFPVWTARLVTRLGWTRLLPLIAVLLSLNQTFLEFMFGPSIAALVRILIGGLFFALLVFDASAPMVGIVALGVGAFLRIVLFELVSIHPKYADMFPLIQAAIEQLLKGASPYRDYFFPSRVPLTYLPLSWLSYLPASVAGLDIRLTNILALVAVFGAVYLAAGRSSQERRSNAAFYLFAWLMLSPSALSWDTGSGGAVSWAFLAWTVLLVATKRGAAAPTLGACLASTVLTVPLLPFVALGWVRDFGLAGAFRRMGIALAVAAALIAPWALWSPRDFHLGIVEWFNRLDLYPTEWWTYHGSKERIAGFAGLFWGRGLQMWLKPLQALILVALAVLFLRRHSGSLGVPVYGAAALLLFMTFNPVVFRYYYQPAVIVALVGVALELRAVTVRNDEAVRATGGGDAAAQA